MPDLDTYKKLSKQVLRWHREGNRSVGGWVRKLSRYRDLTDEEVLALDLRLADAQEIVALEEGYASWMELLAAFGGGSGRERGLLRDRPLR